MGDLPWGVGILGFVPAELRKEQLEVVREIRPPYAIIAGGRPARPRSSTSWAFRPICMFLRPVCWHRLWPTAHGSSFSKGANAVATSAHAAVSHCGNRRSTCCSRPISTIRRMCTSSSLAAFTTRSPRPWFRYWRHPWLPAGSRSASSWARPISSPPRGWPAARSPKSFRGKPSAAGKRFARVGHRPCHTLRPLPICRRVPLGQARTDSRRQVERRNPARNSKC